MKQPRTVPNLNVLERIQSRFTFAFDRPIGRSRTQVNAHGRSLTGVSRSTRDEQTIWASVSGSLPGTHASTEGTSGSLDAACPCTRICTHMHHDVVYIRSNIFLYCCHVCHFSFPVVVSFYTLLSCLFFSFLSL